jgi:hypothetical protein
MTHRNTRCYIPEDKALNSPRFQNLKSKKKKKKKKLQNLYPKWIPLFFILLQETKKTQYASSLYCMYAYKVNMYIYVFKYTCAQEYTFYLCIRKFARICLKNLHQIWRWKYRTGIPSLVPPVSPSDFPWYPENETFSEQLMQPFLSRKFSHNSQWQSMISVMALSTYVLASAANNSKSRPRHSSGG